MSDISFIFEVNALLKDYNFAANRLQNKDVCGRKATNNAVNPG